MPDNIFESDCDAIINTINCVGNMGGGLARQFRLRYPVMNEAYCVDPETEILTSSGWKSYTNVQIGELALTLNHETSLSEWQPIDAVNMFNVTNEQMLSCEGWAHSSLTTLNHRWPVVRQCGRGTRSWSTSATLGVSDSVPISAECGDLPVEAKYTDAFVEVVAWAWTEGTYHKDQGKGVRDLGGTNGIVISQSQRVNQINCERIRAALTSLIGPSVERLDRTGTQWRETAAQNSQRFVIGSKIGKTIRAVAPDRVPTFEFLMSLTRAQLSLFVEVSMLADGTARGILSQKNHQAAEAFQFACILAGQATSIREINAPSHYSRYGYHMTGVCLRKQRSTRPALQKSCEALSYTGDIWCPTTKNGTWLARRRGSVYFTGNSHACANGQVETGKMWNWWDAEEERWLINFPTKDDWRNPSELSYVESGLKDLRDVIADLHLTSIAVPPLGCGLGGLSWADVLPLIKQYLGDLDGVRVEIYPPDESKYTL